MQNFKNRKFLLVLLLSALVFFARVLMENVHFGYIAALAAVLSLAAFALGGGFAKKWASAVFALFLLISSALSLFYGAKIAQKRESALAFATGEVLSVRATVSEVRFESAYASSYIVNVSEVGGKPVSFGAVLETEHGSSFEYGDEISFEAVLTEAGEEKTYLRGKNVFVCAISENAERTGALEQGLLQKIKEANEKLAERFVKLVGREEGGLCSALILGNKSFVGTGLKLDFSRSGISHLLALSGLHLSVIAGALDLLLRGFLKKKWRSAVLIVSVFAFALFTGLSASVLRAAVMLAFVYAAEFFGEENDGLTALFAAVWVILLVNGNAVYDVGFLLSVFATLGIILTRPVFEGLFAVLKAPRKNALLRALRAVAKYFYGIFTMSAAAFFFTLPIIGFSFGEVSWVGIFANFVFLPLATLLIVSCALFIPLSYVPALSGAVAALCKGLSGAIIALSAWVSDFRGVSVSLRYPFVPYLLLLLLLGIFACIFMKKLSIAKLSFGMLGSLLAFTACFGIYERVSEGDMLVRVGAGRSGEYAAFCAGGESCVIDISTGGYSFMYEALSSREYFCETEIDNLVLTHYHNHHTGSLERLFDAVKVRCVVLPLPETEKEQETFAYICEEISANGAELATYARGGDYESGGFKINFAPLQKLSRSEKPLIAFTVTHGVNTFSYIEGAALESAFDYSAYLASDTVFVGAHGPARKFGVYADIFSGSGRVIFSSGARELFRGTEYLAGTFDIADYGGEMEILYDN
ncbi:MAG: ComEC/Rec2 family competence protein [Clostridia bacterium]|nr:ComEC/Rec2 family competence protein [Clostridia bacterium]